MNVWTVGKWRENDMERFEEGREEVCRIQQW